MKRYLILLSFIIPLNVFSQKPKVILKFCPVALTDGLSFPTIQGGVEIKFSDRIGWYNEYGIKYLQKNMDADVDTNFITPSGFKTKTEFRYYFKGSDKSRGTKFLKNLYAGINLFYIKDNHNTAIEYTPAGDSLTAIDNFGVKKKVVGGNILFGKQLPIGKKFLLDVYAGVGLRARNVINTDKEYNPEHDEIESPADITIMGTLDSIDSKGGKSSSGNLTLGIRICYEL